MTSGGMEHSKSWQAVALHWTTTTMTTIAVMTYVHTTVGAESTLRDSLAAITTAFPRGSHEPFDARRADIEEALDIIENASSGALGEVCTYKTLPAGAALDPRRFDIARQKVDMSAVLLQNLGSVRNTVVLDGIAKSLVLSMINAVAARIIVFNATTDIIIAETWLQRAFGNMDEPIKVESELLRVGYRPYRGLPWFKHSEELSSSLRSSEYIQSAPSESYLGWWTLPYISCKTHQWLISYSLYVRPSDTRHDIRDFLSVDIDISGLEVNQCDAEESEGGKRMDNQIASFRGSHKCHDDTTQVNMTKVNEKCILSLIHSSEKSIKCIYRGLHTRERVELEGLTVGLGWVKGAYVCKCREGFYSPATFTRNGDSVDGFDGQLVEAVWKDMLMNKSNLYEEEFRCIKCAPGCITCQGPEPCLASYNWPFRITLLSFSVFCACCAILLILYVYQHRKLKVFKVASPIFLSITLLGCAIMYLEMAAIFPVLDLYSCIATKWTRHLGFCISYTALLMKTWRVSLTYRVKSAHKVKLTDKQLLQWMIPILLVMLIYLGSWTLSAPPDANVIADGQGLEFYQCEYNWWDHSLAIGEILFLAWGIRVCYNVRNAESLFNEARLISYAIYNIAVVNTAMIAIHLFIFPHAGPDMKYALGFLRTQLSTSVTIFLVFGPKVLRVLRGQGDQWDSRARARGITASFSLNGIRGLVAEETTDLFQENEELKEEIQKLAAQIEFMKIVHMEMHNRHVKPKMGGYFSTHGHNWGAQNPNAKTTSASFIIKTVVERGATEAAAAAVDDSTFPSGSLHRARRMDLLRERKAARERERENQERVIVAAAGAVGSKSEGSNGEKEGEQV